MPTADRVLVVGAGIAGVTAARELVRRGAAVTLVDKSPRVGGRMVNRRVPLNLGGEAVFDHGCQRLTATTEPFRRLLDGLCEAGVLKVWADRLPGLAGGPHFVAPGGMRSVVEHLAAGLHVVSSARLLRLEPVGGRWRVWLDAPGPEAADAVILTPPVPQALDLLPPGAVPEGPTLDALRRVTYARGLTMMAVLGPGGEPMPGPGGLVPSHPAMAWLADNAAKGVSGYGPAITVHAADRFARMNCYAPDHVRGRRFRSAAGLDRFGPTVKAVFQRWRYALPAATFPGACAAFPEVRLAFAGDGFAAGGEPAEAAYLSGLAAGAVL